MLKHPGNLLLCGIMIESRTRQYMSYTGVNESEAFVMTVSIVSKVSNEVWISDYCLSLARQWSILTTELDIFNK